MSFFDKIWIGCKQATYLNEKKKEGKLSSAEGLGLWIHLLYCSFCKLFFRQMEFLERRVKRMPENRFSLSEERKASMKKTIEEGC
jgi:hypothetical protein